MTAKQPKPSTRAIEARIEINAPVEAVWKALTDAEELMRWFPLDARVKPGAGGSLWWSWGEGHDWPSQIEIWEPERHLRATYTSPPTDEKGGDFPSPLAMDFYLEAQGGKTVLRLVHSGFGSGPSWDNEYDGVRRGWAVELRALRHYLENHRGVPRGAAWVRKRIHVPVEEGWKRIMGPQGMLRGGSLQNLREGDRYSIAAATGDTFEGVVQVLGPPNDFSASVENLSDALLRMLLWTRQDGAGEAVVWLSVYGRPEAEVEAFSQRWQNLLHKLFPETP